MKIKSTLIALVLISSSVLAGDKYKSAMKKNLQDWEKAETSTDLLSVANKFYTIAEAEKDKWLPYYYHANCLIVISFSAQDSEAKDAFLDEAEKSVKIILEMAPEESEIHALRSLFYTARLTVDPMTRGQQFVGLSMKAAATALEFNERNPRARYMILANKIGTAEFFGEDTSHMCASASNLLKSWDEYKPESSIHPKWGKDDLEQIVENCNK